MERQRKLKVWCKVCNMVTNYIGTRIETINLGTSMIDVPNLAVNAVTNSHTATGGNYGHRYEWECSSCQVQLDYSVRPIIR